MTIPDRIGGGGRESDGGRERLTLTNKQIYKDNIRLY